MKTIIFMFINCANEKMISGGDRRIVELSKIFSMNYNYEVYIITPKFYSDFLEKNFKLSNFGVNYMTSDYQEVKGTINLLKEYIIRAIGTTNIIINNILDKINIDDRIILYASSTFPPDFYPMIKIRSYLKKNGFDNVKTLVGMHLIAPFPHKGYEYAYLKGKYKVPTFKELIYFVYDRFNIIFNLSMVDTIMVSNSGNMNFLCSNGLSKNKIIVTHGAINFNDAKIFKNDKKNYDCIFLGRFHEQKGLLDLIKIWRLVVDKRHGAKLIIIGDGEDKIKNKLNILIKKERLENNIILPGSLEGVDKYKKLSESKIFLFPSTYESFGMVVLEALACGIPVIAYDLPPYREFFYRGMIRVPIKDINRFASDILKLLNNDDLRQKIVIEGQELVLKYNWDNVARLINDRIK